MGNRDEREADSFIASLDKAQKSELKAYLESYVTESKRSQMHEVLDHRTRQVAVVLENVFQPHNAAAAVRSCECFGFQDLHVIEVDNDHRLNPDVTMGGCKWVSLKHHRKEAGGTEPVLKQLKA